MGKGGKKERRRDLERGTDVRRDGNDRESESEHKICVEERET